MRPAKRTERGRGIFHDSVAGLSCFETLQPSPSRRGPNFFAQFWADFVQIWTEFGQNLDQIWSKFGPNLDQTWSKFGPNLEQIWTKSGLPICSPSAPNFPERGALRPPPRGVAHRQKPRKNPPRRGDFFVLYPELHVASRIPRVRPWIL